MMTGYPRPYRNLGKRVPTSFAEGGHLGMAANFTYIQAVIDAIDMMWNGKRSSSSALSHFPVSQAKLK